MDTKNWGAHPEILSAGPRHIYREAMVARALSKYLKKGRILDAGSGSGSLVAQLARKVHSRQRTSDTTKYALQEEQARQR